MTKQRRRRAEKRHLLRRSSEKRFSPRRRRRFKMFLIKTLSRAELVVDNGTLLAFNDFDFPRPRRKFPSSSTSLRIVGPACAFFLLLLAVTFMRFMYGLILFHFGERLFTIPVNRELSHNG